MCGGTTWCRNRKLPCCGLSPRVRGNPASVAARTMYPGSIPACAGEPEAQSCTGYRCRVYPRVCGGTLAALISQYASWGLSPRVRGNPGDAPQPGAEGRSIPACAGEPVILSSGSTSTSVYPRVCGGTMPSGDQQTSGPGLSPRVRGNPGRVQGRPASLWSIPACAGEPWAGTKTPPGSGVYPRVCGGTTGCPG